jgi:16S rRNA (cytosine1402-N4)-methyltransferase
MHIPVLQKEVIKYLDPKANENFIDCTIGQAGHSLAILEKSEPKGKILGIDQDSEILKDTKYKIQNTKYKNRVTMACDNFANLRKIVKDYKFSPVNGILFDLGMSSWHLGESGRGFSFLQNEPLDMRYNSQNPLTAEKILNFESQIEIEKILREYGEERFSRQIAENIIDFRQIKPIRETFQLVGIIRESIPNRFQNQRIPSATRTFQALRIAVNNEIGNLESALPQALETLSRGGKLAVISFHSLEDRIVKKFFREKEKEGQIKILTKKPLRPSYQEIKSNSRSRSARLRAATKQ